jgi:nicotinamide riboside transporter PnuC
VFAAGTVIITMPAASSATCSSTSDAACKQQQQRQQQQKQQQQQQQQRLHYIDWLRAFIIALVILFHCYDLFFDYTYCAAVYLGIVNAPPAGGTRTAAIVLAQLIQVRICSRFRCCAVLSYD